MEHDTVLSVYREIKCEKVFRCAFVVDPDHDRPNQNQGVVESLPAGERQEYASDTLYIDH